MKVMLSTDLEDIALSNEIASPVSSVIQIFQFDRFTYKQAANVLPVVLKCIY